MRFKYSALAASLVAALTLSGCNGSDSSSGNSGVDTGTPDTPNTGLVAKPNIAIPTQGQFIDAKVEGLHYVSGTKTGKTTADGSYEIDATNPSVAFYLGGEDGLLISSVSGRHVTTPFEATGTHQRAVNLARLLLTINELGSDDSKIVIPQEIQSPGATIKTALKKIKLDDLSTADDLLSALGKTSADLVSEQAAITHMTDSLKDVQRGSTDNLAHWAKGSNWTFVERSATQRVRNNTSSQFQDVIHADRTLDENVFSKTGGLSASFHTLKDASFITRTGSNDGSISGQFAAEYMTCASKDGELSWTKDNNNNDALLCDGQPITIAPEFEGVTTGTHYQYKLTDPTATSTADETTPWNEVKEMGGAYVCMADKNCTEQSLTKFEVITRDDSEKQDGSQMLKEVLSGSYDPITDVYVQTRSKEYLAQSSNPGRISESINFLYPVEAVGQDRYVDFKGTWTATETRPGCDKVAESTYTFTDTGVTLSGKEFDGQCVLSGELNETATYAELASMDYWWFGTNKAGVSKATLDQLNTTVRWNDKGDNGVDRIKINRFSYIPAGKSWDLGVLVRDTLDDSGNKVATILMQKQ